MGKNKKNKSKKQSSKAAESVSAADPSSDSERQSSRATASGDEASEAVTHSPAPASEPSPSQSEDGAGASQSIPQTETTGEETERPLLERLATQSTIDSFVPAPNDKNPGDEDPKSQDPASQSDANPSDGTDAPGDAGAGPHSASKESQSEASAATDGEQLDGQAEDPAVLPAKVFKEAWQLILDEGPSRGIPVTTSKSGSLTALPGQADKGVGAEESQSPSQHAPPGGTEDETRRTSDGKARPDEVSNVGEATENVKEEPETDLASGPGEIDKARLASVEQSPQAEKREAEDDQKESWQVIEEYLQNSKGNQDTMQEAGAPEAEGEHSKETILASLQKQLELERQKNQDLQHELDNALHSSTGPGEQGRRPMLLGPDLMRVQNLTIAADSSSPVTVIADKHGEARILFDQKRHLLEQDTSIFRTITSIVNYVDGIGERPGRAAQEEFEEFRDFTAHRVRVLEAVLDDDDPLTTMQRFEESWSRTAFGTSWGTRLDLRVAAFKAVMYLKYAKDSPQYASAIMNFEDQLAGLRERLGGDVDDPVVLQTQDILRTAAGKK